MYKLRIGFGYIDVTSRFFWEVRGCSENVQKFALATPSPPDTVFFESSPVTARSERRCFWHDVLFSIFTYVFAGAVSFHTKFPFANLVE